jgi:hypothetical protein
MGGRRGGTGIAHCHLGLHAGAVARTPACLTFALALAIRADAQVFRDSTPRPRIEGRIDGAFSAQSTIQLGAGIFVPLGTYVRAGLIGGVGTLTDPIYAAGRVELVGRFLLDPLYEHRWGPYVAGGIGQRWEYGAVARPYLLLLIGVEGPRWGRVTPALEAGVGNGVRVGFALRRAQVTGWR